MPDFVRPTSAIADDMCGGRSLAFCLHSDDLAGVIASASLTAQLLLLLLLSSVLCDVVHAWLHLAQRSRFQVVRALASLHQEHHEFLDQNLRFHSARLWRNMVRHQLPEFAMRVVMVTAVGRLIASPFVVVGAAALLCGAELVVVVAALGRDYFHPSARGTGVKVRGSGFFVDVHYHALHHAFPDHFWSGHVQVLDRVFGRMLPLKGRVVVVVGASAFSNALAAACAAEHALVTCVDATALKEELLHQADIVVLATGAAARGLDSYEVLLQRAQQAHRARLLPLEIWSVGSSQAWAARQALLVNERTLLRTLKRGPVLGALTTLFLLKRGVRVI